MSRDRDAETGLMSISVCMYVCLTDVFLCAFHEKSRTSFVIKLCYLFYRLFGITIHLLETNRLPLIICYRTVVGVSLCAFHKETCTVNPFSVSCLCETRLLETIMHFLEIKWRLIKNLLRCGFRRDLVRFHREMGALVTMTLIHCSLCVHETIVSSELPYA